MGMFVFTAATDHAVEMCAFKVKTLDLKRAATHL